MSAGGAPSLGQASQELLDNARRYADEKARAQIDKETAGWAARYAELEKKVEELQEQVKSLPRSSSRKASTRSGSTTSLKSPTKRLLQSSTSLNSQIPPQPVFSASTSPLPRASHVPLAAVTQTGGSTSIDSLRLSEKYTRLQHDHARLQKKYAALAAVHQENNAKYSRERKVWRDCKRLIKTVMDTTPGFKQACGQIQKEMDREDERVLDATLSKTAKKGSTSRRSHEGGSPVARVSFDSGRMLPTQATSIAASGSAATTAKVTGKRKRGHEEQPTSTKASGSGRQAGSSSANATPTKNRSSQLSHRSSPAGPAQKPLRTPTKRYAPPAPIPDHNEDDLPASARSSKSRVSSHRQAGNTPRQAELPISDTQLLQPRSTHAAAVAAVTPPRQQEQEAGLRSFTDCSEIYLAALNQLEKGVPTSDAPEVPVSTDRSMAEAYVREEEELNRQAEEHGEHGYNTEMTASQLAWCNYYESGAYREDPEMTRSQERYVFGGDDEYDEDEEEYGRGSAASEVASDPSELAEEAFRHANGEKEKYEQEQAEVLEREEALQGPTSSQIQYLEAAARPPAQLVTTFTSLSSSHEVLAQAKESEKTASNRTSGLACIFPLPENAYKQVSPGKSVIDESVPVHALRKRVRAHNPPSSGPKVKPTKEEEQILQKLLDDEDAGMRLPLHQLHYEREARPEHAPSDASHDCARLGCCDAGQHSGRASEATRRSPEAPHRDQTERNMEMQDDEETETSSRPSSPARLPVAAAISAGGERPTSSGSNDEANFRSSRTLMPDPPSTEEKREKAVPSSPKLPPVEEGDLTDQMEEKEKSPGHAYLASQRLPAYGKSAVFDESKDVVMRTLTKEKLPPRKAKQAENTPVQASRKELVPPRPIEESSIGSFITDLRSGSFNKASEGTPQTLSRAVASQSARAGSIDPPPGSAMWRHPVKKKQKEKRRASAIVAVASASILPPSTSTTSAAKQVPKRDASVMSRGKMVSAQVVGPAKDYPDADRSEQINTPQPAPNLRNLLEPDAAATAGEDSASSRANKALKSGDAVASVLERTSDGVSAGLGASSSKMRKSLLAPMELETPGDSAKKAAQKKKKGRGGIALPDDVEDDLTAVGRAILQAKGTPGAEGGVDTPVTAKRLNVDQLLQQAEKKRQRESAGHSSLNRQKRKLDSNGVIGNTETPTAGSSSKRSKAEPGSAKEADKPSQPQRERDYSEPYEGQEFMRKIHRQRKAEMEGDPFKHKGKGAYAGQMAGALAAKNLARIEVNPDQNNGVPFIYQETVRGKEARKQLHGVDCDCCHGYFENAVRHLPVEQRADAIQKMINDTSRHRQQFEPAKTPPEYWQMGFPDSQGVEKIREEAEKINEEKRKKQEAEANKCDGRFRYR